VANSKRRIELIYQVLENLGVLIPGQAPSDEMVSKVDGLLDATLASLAAREVLYVADAGTADPPNGGEFDLAIFLPLADIVANRAGPSFNLAGDPKLYVLMQQGEEELRVIGRPARTRKTLKTDAQLRNRPYYRGGGNYTSGT
jgi:hypothetical protein